MNKRPRQLTVPVSQNAPSGSVVLLALCRTADSLLNHRLKITIRGTTKSHGVAEIILPGADVKYVGGCCLRSSAAAGSGALRAFKKASAGIIESYKAAIEHRGSI